MPMVKKNTFRTKNICIVGGGFGGLYTAIYLQNSKWLMAQNVQVTVVEPKDHFLFSPLLYEKLTDELATWEIAPSLKHLLTHPKVRHCRDRVEAIDLKHRQVTLVSGNLIDYDYMVLAIGNQSAINRIPGMAEYGYHFRSLADAKRLYQTLWQLENSDVDVIQIAIVGAGPNGIELACKLADRLQNRGSIFLLDRGQRILKLMPSPARKIAYQALYKRGVQLILETEVHHLDAAKIHYSAQGKRQALAVDLVIWTAGNQPHSWLEKLPLLCNGNGKVITTATLQSLYYPEVFALGDLADVSPSNRQSLPLTAQVAYQQATCVAHNLQALVRQRTLKPFRYLHLGDMLTLGKKDAIIVSFGLTLCGPLAKFIRKLVYLNRLPTFRHRMNVLCFRLKNKFRHKPIRP